MSKRLIIFIVLILELFLSGLSMQAQSVLSAGCTYLNDPQFDSFYNSSGILPAYTFNANEYILVQAKPPITQGTPTTINIYDAQNSIVASSSFPGSVSYIIPSTGTYTLGWDVDGNANATWIVSCTDSPPPSPVSSSIITNSCPHFFDGRINNCDDGNWIVIYGHDYDSGRGLLITDTDGNVLLLVSPEQIAAVPECPEINTLIASGGGVSIYRLADCEYMVIGPAADGKHYYVTFDELYADAGYSSHEE